MSRRRFNADTPLDAETRRKVEEFKRDSPDARELFERIRADQLRDHPPIDHGGDHTPAQKANATQMANKAVAMSFLDWP